jgi:hypothetical protein
MNELIKGYDKENLEGMIENEGLDYFFNGYISFENIIDPELREAVFSYKQAREEIIYVLSKNGIEVDE